MNRVVVLIFFSINGGFLNGQITKDLDTIYIKENLRVLKGYFAQSKSSKSKQLSYEYQEIFHDSLWLRHGVYIEYYPNGFIKKVIPYSEGTIKGSQLFYSIKGTISRYEDVVNNKLNGRFIEYYYLKQQVRITGEYKSNNRIGVWKEYYPNGNLKSIGSYADSSITISLNESYVLTITANDSNIISESPLSIRRMDSIEVELGVDHKLPLPYTHYFKKGIWKYYDPDGNITELEY